MWLENDMIEVDLMPTFEGENTPIQGQENPLWQFVVGKSIVPGLDSSIKGGRCD